MTESTPLVDSDELERLVVDCESKRSSGPVPAWGKALGNLSRAMTPLTVAALITEVRAARAEIVDLRERLYVADAEIRELEIT